MKITAPLVALASSLLLLLPAANAQVTYTATDISGSTWQYNYTVTNDLTVNLTEFTTFFSLGQYSNLVTESAPGTWSPIVAQPDPNLPNDGLYDSLALDSGLATGATESGFSVQFTYLGTGTPGSQLFNFVDCSGFPCVTLAAGDTTLSGGTVAVPEIDTASTLGAMTFFLGMLVVMRGRRDPASRG